MALILAQSLALRAIEAGVRKKLRLEQRTFKANPSKNNNINRTWVVKNLDTQERIRGQWSEESYDESIEANYAEASPLNSDQPIIQFISGASDTVSFKGTLFAKHSDQYKDVKKIAQKLKLWTRIDKNLGRPPLVQFYLGDGSIMNYRKAIIISASPTYKRINGDGDHIAIDMNMVIKRFVPYEPEAVSFDTRYHTSIDGDYHEMLAFREYGDPLLGVVVRQNNEQTLLEIGDTVKLPAITGSLSNARIKESSVILDGITGTPTTRLTDNIQRIVEEHIDKRTKQNSILFEVVT